MAKGFSNGNDMTARMQARQDGRDARYQLDQAMKAFDESGKIMPGGVYSPGRSNPYFDVVRKQYRVLDGMVKVGERSKEVGERLGTLFGELDAALAEGKEGKALRVQNRIEKARKEQKHLRQDFGRFRNDYAAISNGLAAGGIVAGTVIGLAVGAWALGPMVHPQSNPPAKKGKDVYVPYSAPSDKIYHVADDGTLYENDTPIAKSDIIAKVNETILFTEKQIADHTKFLQGKYNSRDLGMKFNADGSLHVSATDSESQVFHDLDARTVHNEILTKLAGKDGYGNQIGHVLLPFEKVNGTETDFNVDKSFQQSITNITGVTEAVDVVKITYDSNGVMHAYAGSYDKDGNFTGANITEKQARDSVYLLADNNPDADQPVDKMLDAMKNNAESISRQAFMDAMKAHDKLLAKYNVSNDDELDTMLQGLEDYRKEVDDFFKSYDKGNVSDVDAMIKDLQALNESRTKLLNEWNATNETELNDTINDLNKYIRDLEGNWSRANDTQRTEIEGWMARVNSTVSEYQQYLLDNKTRYESMIDNITAKMKEVASAFNITNLLKSARSTEAFEILENLTADANISKYRLSFSDPAQLGVAKKAFGDAVVKRWTDEGMTGVRIIDGTDDENGAATASLFQSSKLQYTEAVTSETFESHESDLKPYYYK